MTEITRRSLLRGGAGIAAVTLVGLRPWSAATAAAATPGWLRRSAYAGLTGQEFSAGTVPLRLLSVADVGGAVRSRALAGSEDAFVLTFAGPVDAPLVSGVHALANATLGSFELFLSPVERPSAELHYEVVVDRSIGVPEAKAEAQAIATEIRTDAVQARARARRARVRRRRRMKRIARRHARTLRRSRRAHRL